jgi:hypothetical protein
MPHQDVCKRDLVPGCRVLSQLTGVEARQVHLHAAQSATSGPAAAPGGGVCVFPHHARATVLAASQACASRQGCCGRCLLPACSPGRRLHAAAGMSPGVGLGGRPAGLSGLDTQQQLVCKLGSERVHGLRQRRPQPTLPAGWPRPLGSMSSLSGLVCRMSCASAGSSMPDCAQHMQPPAICRTVTLPSPPAALRSATASMPTAPNSFTTTHQRCVRGGGVRGRVSQGACACADTTGGASDTPHTHLVWRLARYQRAQSRRLPHTQRACDDGDRQRRLHVMQRGEGGGSVGCVRGVCAAGTQGGLR